MQKKSLFLWISVILAGGLLYSHLSFNRNRQANLCANPGSCTSLPALQVDNGAVGTFQNEPVIPPAINLALESVPSQVLGQADPQGEKHIYVDLATQTLKAYSGHDLFMEAKVSTGKWNPTPVGDYTIWIKLRSTRMSGGEGADAYNLPNVPYVMFFYNSKIPKISGYSFHGAYWHDNFGHPMSHGCVNMREIDAHKLYDWASPTTVGSSTYATLTDPGTKVTIY